MPNEPALTTNNQRFTAAWWDEYYTGRASGAVRLALNGDVNPERSHSYLDYLVERGQRFWRPVERVEPAILTRQVAVSPEDLRRANFLVSNIDRMWGVEREMDAHEGTARGG